MQKAILVIFLIIFPLQGFCSAEERCFVGELEFGPNRVNFGQLPKTILPQEQNKSTGSILSYWLSLGYKFKKFRVISQYALAGSGDTRHKEGKDPYNAARIYLASLAISSQPIKIKRAVLGCTFGYQYSYFNSFATNNQNANFRYVDSDILGGIKATIKIRDAINNKVKKFDIITGNVSYEYANLERPLKKFRFSLRGLTEESGFITLNFTYISQDNIYRLFAVTIGGYGYFGF